MTPAATVSGATDAMMKARTAMTPSRLRASVRGGASGGAAADVTSPDLNSMISSEVAAIAEDWWGLYGCGIRRRFHDAAQYPSRRRRGHSLRSCGRRWPSVSLLRRAGILAGWFHCRTSTTGKDLA